MLNNISNFYNINMLKFVYNLFKKHRYLYNSIILWKIKIKCLNKIYISYSICVKNDMLNIYRLKAVYVDTYVKNNYNNL